MNANEASALCWVVVGLFGIVSAYHDVHVWQGLQSALCAMCPCSGWSTLVGYSSAVLFRCVCLRYALGFDHVVHRHGLVSFVVAVVFDPP